MILKGEMVLIFGVKWVDWCPLLRFPGIKIMASFGLPRGQRTANLKVIQKSNELVKKY